MRSDGPFFLDPAACLVEADQCLTHDVQRTLELVRQAQARPLGPRLQAHAAVLLGAAQLYSGDLQQAQQHFRTAVLHSRSAGDLALECRSLSSLGIALHQQGQYEEALESFLLALQQVQPDDLFGHFRLMSNLGNAYMELGEYDLALHSHLEAVGLAERHGDEIYVLLAQINIVIDRVKLGQYDQGLELSAQSLAHIRRYPLPQHELVLLAHTLSALMHSQLPETWRDVLDTIEVLLGSHSPALSRDDVVHALLVSGEGRLRLGEPERALPLADEALHIAEESGLMSRVSALYQLRSEVHRAQGRWAEAYHDLHEHHEREQRLRTAAMERRLRMEAHRQHIRLLEQQARAERERREHLQAQQEAMTALAYRDTLTGLMNRPAFRQAADQAVEQKGEGFLGLLFIDLDGFKPLNDVYGHAFGDLVLQAVGQQLHDRLRPGDLAARLGGDEFVILIRRENAPEVRAFERHLRQGLNTVLVIENRQVRVGASVGLAISEHATTISVLMQQADAAMYAQKQQTHRARF